MQHTFYGGQAVIEGVMMRGRRVMAVAVRGPDQRIVVRVEPLAGLATRWRVAGWPFARGIVLLVETLRLGMRALLISVGVAGGDPDPPAPAGRQVTIQLARSLGLSLAVLFVLPLLLVLPLDGLIAQDWVSVLLEGLIRLGLLVGYLLLLRSAPEVQRVFGYHGAEHQTINAFEAGAELTPRAVARFGLLHPRCGTGFLLLVVLLSIVAFGLLGRPELPARLASRILVLPVIAAVAYEYIRLSATLARFAAGRWLAAPSQALQRLTTRPPDDSMREVAIAALARVLHEEATAPAPGSGRHGVARA